MRHRRLWRGLVALAALILIGSAGTSEAQQGPPPVTVASPVVKEIVEDDEFVGRFDAVAQVEVRARITGYLEDVHFEDGALVEAGDLLFTIDRRQFVTALRQAEAQIDVAIAAHDFAEEQLARAESLIQNGTIPQSTLDERREAFLAALGALEQARAAQESARIDLEFSEIRAPIAGRIGRRLVTEGNLVAANDTVLATIVSLDPIYFYFDIDERYYLAYARDARVRGASLQAGGGGLPIRVTLSDDREEPRDGSLDFSENRLDEETGSMRVRAILENADHTLTPGLFGRVNVPGSLPYQGVLVPDEAILSDQNRRLVLLVDEEGVVSPRDVRPGPRIDGYRVIRDGLDGSETIIIEGLVVARPGMTVAPERVELPPIAEN
ncbi:MAG: efflux RND transporter periplasmic adaptor subunit [Pseudomonadota bacterium]